MLARSPKIMKFAQGKDCTLRLPGCNFDPSTTVACHIGIRRGMGIKCGDNMVVLGCSNCHATIDAHSKKAFPGDKLRALEETQELFLEAELMSVA